ncbi:angiomotin-like protein 1 isoform X2 [Lampetra fluviatilis]
MGDPYARERALEMRAAEDNSGKVLQRLIQEQLRYGGVTDNRGLLAIQQQATTAGSPTPANATTGAGASHGALSLAPASLGVVSLGGAPAATAGSSISSTESLVQDLRQSARQEPQGQEHQSSETPEKQAQRLALLQQQALQQQQYQQQQYQQHHTATEELPSYEEAKVHSQYYSSLQSQGQGQTVHQARMSNTGPAAFYVTATVGAQKGRTEGRPAVQRTSPLPIMQDDGLKELKQGHVRSLSERLMQLTLEKNGAKAQLPLGSSPPSSVPQQSSADFCRFQNQSPPQRPYDPRGPPPEYPFKHKAAFAPQGSPLQLNQFTALQHQHHHHVPGAAEQHLLRYQPPPEYNMARQTQQGMQHMQMQYHSPSASQGSAGSLSMQMPGAGALPGPVQNLGSMTLTTAVAQHTPMYAGLGGQLSMAHTAGPGEELHFMLLRSQQTVELLTEENQLLRSELESYCEKDVKLQKMEREVLRISEAYENLEKSTSKRETLEKAMRTKMESEIRRLHDFNRDLRDRLETSNKQLASREYENSEDNKLTIAKLIAQNKETLLTKEKLEVELAGLRSANGDQRRHIELLNQAFSSSEAKAAKLQEELKKKQFYVDKVEKLQQALSQLQVACEKREQLERRLRTRLERELETLRAQQGAPPPGATSEHAAPALMELLREKEERVLALEADMMRWEQKYLEESAMRQFAMDAAATAATERDTTIIANSPNASFSEEEEFMLASRRCHDMEGRIKNLHAQIIEKDAMIKVLQQRSRKEQQGKTESSATSLRPAKSVPSIAAAAAASGSPGGGLASGLAARKPPMAASPSLEERLGARTGSFSGLVSTELAEEGSTASLGLSPMRALSPLPPPSPHFTHVKSSSKDSSTQTERGAQEGSSSPHVDPAAAERKKSNTLPRGSKMLPSLHILRVDARDRADMKMSAGEKSLDGRPPLPMSGLPQEDQMDNEMVEILI